MCIVVRRIFFLNKDINVLLYLQNFASKVMIKYFALFEDIFLSFIVTDRYVLLFYGLLFIRKNNRFTLIQFYLSFICSF